MKILQINNVYKNGSTGKITYDIHKYLLEHNIESVVCYGRGEKIQEPNVYKISNEFYSKLNHFIANITGIMYGHCFFSTRKLINIIKKEKPDIVHLQCINGYFVNIYKLINWLKKNKVKTIVTLHAEFMHTANCGYALECDNWKTGCGKCPRLKQETGSYLFDNTHISWKNMKKAFDGFDNNLIITSVSPWLMERAKISPILANKNHKVVLNGLDTNIFHYYNTKELRSKYINENGKIIFHATPSFNLNPNHIKGGYYVIELAKKLKNENVKILVAGDYQKEIEIPENVILLGKIKNQQELAKYYSMADITLLTSKKETFSMATAESLCCGTPVVGFKAGAPEQITIKEYSEFVDYGDINLFLKAINNMFNKDINKKEISKMAYSKYCIERMASEYVKIYKELINKKEVE